MAEPELPQVVYVDFSERIVGDALGVVVTGRSGKCQGAPLPAASKASGFPIKANGAGEIVPAEGELSTTSLQLTCSGLLDLRDEVVLEIKPGFRSSSGLALNAGKAMQISARATDWSDWGQSGKQLRLAMPQ